MNGSKRVWRVVVWVAALALLMGFSGVARADDEPADVLATEQVVLPETISDAPSPQSVGNYRLYMSTPGSGAIGNLAYADEDILSYKPATGQWVKTFDGTNAGLPAAADVDAFAYAYNNQTYSSNMYMSFNEPVSVPGLGKVDDSDVVVYRVTLTSGTWQMVFDGSQYGLTTAAEDVDGFELASPDEFLISTTGNFSVPGHYGNTVTGGDEDIIRYVNGKFSLVMDGTAIGLVADSDVTSLAYDYGGIGENYYLVTNKPYNIDGVSGGAGTILLYTKGNYAIDHYERWWQPTGVSKIDALDVKLE